MLKWLAAAFLVITSSSLAMHLHKSRIPQDCGFVQNSFGERVSWKEEGVIKLYVHDSVPSAFFPAIQSAALTWEKSLGRRLFQIETVKISGPIAPHEDGKNIIYFMNTWEERRTTEQGRTSIYWNGDQIIEADVRINAKDFQFYWHEVGGMGSVNFEALILHEMGHVLGLKHKDKEGSVMATFLPSGVNRTHLAGVDKANLQCEYQSRVL